jgi:hypothetical protein
LKLRLLSGKIRLMMFFYVFAVDERPANRLPGEFGIVYSQDSQFFYLSADSAG